MYWSDDEMFRFKPDHVRDTHDTDADALGFARRRRAPPAWRKPFGVNRLEGDVAA
jgi:hypothetical protein